MTITAMLVQITVSIFALAHKLDRNPDMVVRG